MTRSPEYNQASWQAAEHQHVSDTPAQSLQLLRGIKVYVLTVTESKIQVLLELHKAKQQGIRSFLFRCAPRHLDKSLQVRAVISPETTKQIWVKKVALSFLNAQHSVDLTALSMTDQQSLQKRNRADDRVARRQPHEA